MDRYYQETFVNTDFLIADERLTLRPMEKGDADFLYRLYASTRMDEMALVDWAGEQKEAFLRMQFHAQTEHYRLQYPHAETQIIQRDEAVPIGRLILDRSNDCILLMDIALLPEFRNAGIGTTIMRDLMAEAAQANREVRLHVETFNPAMKLYTRLGFAKSSEQGIYHEMVWKAGADQA